MKLLPEQYFKVKYRAGVENGAADFLSRNANHETEIEYDEGNLVSLVSGGDMNSNDM